MKGNVILKPIISEKSLADAKVGKYTFVVARHASKREIKKAVSELFKVDVEKVYTSVIKTVSSRVTRFGRKVRESSYKKARVKVKKDQKIDIFEEALE